MWLTGPVAPRHVGSSQTRARTRVPCIGRQILNHCATREALQAVSVTCVPATLMAISFPPSFYSGLPWGARRGCSELSSSSFCTHFLRFGLVSSGALRYWDQDVLAWDLPSILRTISQAESCRSHVVHPLAPDRTTLFIRDNL